MHQPSTETCACGTVAYLTNDRYLCCCERVISRMHFILRPSIHMIGYPSRGTRFQSIEHVIPTIFKASASVDSLLRRYVFVTPTIFDLAMSLCWVGTISKPNFMLIILINLIPDSLETNPPAQPTETRSQLSLQLYPKQTHFQLAFKMLVKLAIVLLFTLAQTVVLVGSTFTGLVRAGHFIKADGKGEEETHNLRKMKKGQVDESIALQDGDTIDMDDSPIIPGLRALRRENNSKNWNHGTNEVAAKRRDRMEVCAPSTTKDGDTLFLFLR